MRKSPDPRPAIKQLCRMTATAPSTAVLLKEKSGQRSVQRGDEHEEKKTNIDLKNDGAGLT